MSWRLLLTATLLFTSSSLVWSACDVNFHVPSSINATVNSTVVLKCTSQCTPLRIIRAHRDSHLKEESELGKEIEDQNDPYIVNIIVKLNTTFNNSVVFCSTFSSTGAVTSNNVSVIIQDYLGPASDLKFAVIDNRLVFSWSAPSVLKGIKLKYNVQFSLDRNNITSRANISTSSFSTPLVDPCLEGSFSVTPTADTLTGQTQTLTQHFPKDAPVIKYVKERFIREGQTVTIILQYLISTVNCYGDVHTGGKLFTWCRYSKRHNNYSISNARDNIHGRAVRIPVRTHHDIKLPAHDFCFVNVTLQYGAGQITGSQPTINISLFDTQSIKIQANSSTLTICVICQFANWAIVPGCFIKLDFYYEEGHNSTNAVAFRNHTREAKHCFHNLATGEYTAHVSVSDYDPHNDSVSHHVAVVGHTVVEFSPTHPPEADVSDMTALWSSLSVATVIVIVGAIICLTVFGVKLWHKIWRESTIPLESYTSQSMDHSTNNTFDESQKTESGLDPIITAESDSKKHSDLDIDDVPRVCCDGIDMKEVKGQEKRDTLAVKDIDSEKLEEDFLSEGHEETKKQDHIDMPVSSRYILFQDNKILEQQHSYMSTNSSYYTLSTPGSSEHYTLEPEDVLQTLKSTSEQQGGFIQATGNTTDESGVLKRNNGVPAPENGSLRFRGPQGQDDNGK